MAKGGAFNISELVRELGLTAVTSEDLRVLQTIQPVLNVGDLSDVTPPHVAASSMFGFTVTAAGGLLATMELQCLAPGGCFIEWIVVVSTTNVGMRVTTAAIAAGQAVVAPAGQTSRDPIVSVVRQGDVAAPGIAEAVVFGATSFDMSFGPNPIFIPRASFFSLQALVANTAATISFGVREVPASEHVPA